MNFVHSGSQECTKSELDLFSVPPTQISLEKGHWIDHQPVASLADGGAITFLSPGTEDYVDLVRTILVIRAKVTKADGTNLGVDEKVRFFPRGQYPPVRTLIPFLSLGWCGKQLLAQSIQTGGCFHEGKTGHAGNQYLRLPRLSRNPP